jgi:hypothetical protein
LHIRSATIAKSLFSIHFLSERAERFLVFIGMLERSL